MDKPNIDSQHYMISLNIIVLGNTKMGGGITFMKSSGRDKVGILLYGFEERRNYMGIF